MYNVYILTILLVTFLALSEGAVTSKDRGIFGSPGLARKATNLGNPKRWAPKGEKNRENVLETRVFGVFFLVLCEFFGEVKVFEV